MVKCIHDKIDKEEVQWVRSGRKTIAIQVKEDGSVVVRIPWRVTRKQAEAYLSGLHGMHLRWELPITVSLSGNRKHDGAAAAGRET